MTTDRDPIPLHPEHERLLDEATGDAPRAGGELAAATEMERAAAALHGGLAERRAMPQSLAMKLRTLAEQSSRSQPPAALPFRAPGPGPGAATTSSGFRLAPWIAAAACLGLAGGMLFYGYQAANQRMQAQRELEGMRVELAKARDQVRANETMLAEARSRVSELDTQLASVQREQLALAEQLAKASADLDRANLEIARYELPEDPEVLAQNRRKLLEVPDTIRVAWKPFDLPDALAEVQGIDGDVVWNDKLQTGYLRFVGLPVNDPGKEQYQVWVIDERGMEQKVSGGVFNATAMGEVIVPIDPAIDVRRVALFAITIEEPGGTWVPDLKRRVVVAPREG